jgi:hypothetical protein
MRVLGFERVELQPGLPSAPTPRRCASRVVLLTAAIGGPGKRFDGSAES